MSEKKGMGCIRSKKMLYSVVAVASAIAGMLCGNAAQDSGLYEPSEKLYREPYTSEIFAYRTPSEGAARFADMNSGDWFYTYVDGLVRSGIINGRSDTEYDPQGTLTLPECAALIVRCLGLESEASVASARIGTLGLAGFDKWYIGYMKICVDAGIVPSDDYGFGYDSDGNFVMKHDYFETVPIKRCELADLLYRMTTLEGGSVLAKNTYTERGGYGHELIRSGLYDMTAVYKYSGIITDFESIPEKHREGVLACYYNGIFNGDDSGRFNPNSSLTRAEMSKVVSVITDISQRFGEDMRDGAFTVTAADTRKDMYGDAELTKDAGYRILGVSADAAQIIDGTYLRIPLIANAPLGYALEVHVYSGSENESGVFFEELGTVGVGTSGIYRSGDYADFGIDDGSIIKAVYLLRNIADGGDVEGVLEMRLENGTLVPYDGISRINPPTDTANV